MSTLEQLYAQAEKRRGENQLPYAGAISPAEAFELLQLDPRRPTASPALGADATQTA